MFGNRVGHVKWFRRPFALSAERQYLVYDMLGPRLRSLEFPARNDVSWTAGEGAEPPSPHILGLRPERC